MKNEKDSSIETSNTSVNSYVPTYLDDSTHIGGREIWTKQSSIQPFKTQLTAKQKSQKIPSQQLVNEHLQPRWSTSPRPKIPRVRDQSAKLLKKIAPYLTVGTLYILSDPLMDFGFVAIPSPWDAVYYVGRYTALILYSLFKFVRSRRKTKTTPFFISANGNPSFKQRRRSPAARLRRSVKKQKEECEIC
jgi:hypothetical protein